MTLEVNFSVKCNLSCSYCYQNPVREAGNSMKINYDLDKVFNALSREKQDFTIFGGEPLLIPIDDLEKMFSYGFERHKKNGIQTNGLLITPRHVELFKKYNVSVGVSIDGPEELNEARTTIPLTRKTQENLESLAAAQISRSIIITLSRTNSTSQRRAKFLTWIKELERLGYLSIRLHLLENDGDINHIRLTDAELIDVLEGLQQLETTIKFDFFDEIYRRIAGDLKAGSCVFHGCDPLTTPAVQSVDGNGIKHNCTRVNKTGVDYVKAESHADDRSVILYHTPQEHGGCKGCRFFSVCKGYCPGTALNNDWRYRTEFCNVLKHFYRRAEARVIRNKQLPISLTGKRFGLTGERNREHGDRPHGDIPHGDRSFITVPVRRTIKNSMGESRGSAILGADLPQNSSSSTSS